MHFVISFSVSIPIAVSGRAFAPVTVVRFSFVDSYLFRNAKQQKSKWTSFVYTKAFSRKNNNAIEPHSTHTRTWNRRSYDLIVRFECFYFYFVFSSALFSRCGRCCFFFVCVVGGFLLTWQRTLCVCFVWFSPQKWKRQTDKCVVRQTRESGTKSGIEKVCRNGQKVR